MTAWVVGLWREPPDPWEVIGVFSDEAKALAACRTPQHFLAPIKVDQDIGDQTLDWPIFRYPNVQNAMGDA